MIFTLVQEWKKKKKWETKIWDISNAGKSEEIILKESLKWMFWGVGKMRSWAIAKAAKGGSGSSLNEIRGYERWVEQDDCLVCYSKRTPKKYFQMFWVVNHAKSTFLNKTPKNVCHLKYFQLGLTYQNFFQFSYLWHVWRL